MLLLLGDVETEEWPGETKKRPLCFRCQPETLNPNLRLSRHVFGENRDRDGSELFSSSPYYEDESLQQSGAVHKNIQEPPHR